MMPSRRRIFGLLMLMYLIKAWKALSQGVKPFDWLMLATELIVVMLIAYEIWCKEWLQARARREVLTKTFAMTFDDAALTKAVPVGRSQIDVNVLIGHQVEIRRFGFRFVETTNGGNAPMDIVNVEHIVVVRPQNPTSLQHWPDGKGGIYCQWQPHPVHDAGEALHFKVVVNASRPWSGYLSFRSYDADGQLRFVRQTFQFTASL